MRGRERSIPPETIIAEINRHAAEGYREVTLTGTQLGTYGFDLSGANLQGLLERILTETDVERVRVSSLQAHEITAPLLRLWSDYRLMPHFHIPLQSGCDTTLRAMRRRYSASQFSASVELVRQMYPDAGITTDIIVGFPGESGEDFAASLAIRYGDAVLRHPRLPLLLQAGNLGGLLRDQVAEPEKRARMGEMLALSAESALRFRESQLGAVRPVLWEKSSGREESGRASPTTICASEPPAIPPVQPNHRRPPDRAGRRLGAGRSGRVRENPLSLRERVKACLQTQDGTEMTRQIPSPGGRGLG